MKKKMICSITGICLAAAVFCGCAQTPETSIIKPKGTASLKNYEEGEALAPQEGETKAVESESGSENAAGEQSSEKVMETEAAEQETENLLRASLGAPEHYASEVTDETGNLKISTDAVVEIPNAQKVSSIEVTQHPLTQEFLDRVTKMFFPEGTVYYLASEYYDYTRADWVQRLEELKGFLAEGNMDPYDYGTDEDGNYIFDIYAHIAEAEQGCQEAPAELNLTEVQPQLGVERDERGDDSFALFAKQPDESVYQYTVKSYSSYPMEIDIKRSYGKGKSYMWMDYDIAENNQNKNGIYRSWTSREQLDEQLGISYEDALAIAQEKIGMLGLEDVVVNKWNYCIADDINTMSEILDYGYQFFFTRRLQDIPVTYTFNLGGAYESMDSVMENWAYENIEVVVTKDGLASVHLINIYDIGEVRTENLNLLSFDEIIDIYEKMMLIKNADVLNYENFRIYETERITLGYGRIYEPSAQDRVGLLVPVWDFFGTFRCQSEYEGEIYDSDSGIVDSCLTINAVDGSIIDRSLGY